MASAITVLNAEAQRLEQDSDIVFVSAVCTELVRGRSYHAQLLLNDTIYRDPADPQELSSATKSTWFPVADVALGSIDAKFNMSFRAGGERAKDGTPHWPFQRPSYALKVIVLADRYGNGQVFSVDDIVATTTKTVERGGEVVSAQGSEGGDDNAFRSAVWTCKNFVVEGPDTDDDADLDKMEWLFWSKNMKLSDNDFTAWMVMELEVRTQTEGGSTQISWAPMGEWKVIDYKTKYEDDGVSGMMCFMRFGTVVGMVRPAPHHPDKRKHYTMRGYVVLKDFEGNVVAVNRSVKTFRCPPKRVTTADPPPDDRDPPDPE